MRGHGWDARLAAALAATVILWASAFAGIRAGLEAYGPGQVALMRLLVASVVLALYAAVTRAGLPRVRDLPGIFLAGFFAFALYHVALNYGEVTVSAGAASVLINTAPVITALLAATFLGERLRVAGWVGIGVSFVGAVMISLGEGGGFRLDPRASLVLLAALSTSVYFVLQKPYLRRYGALAFTTYAVCAGAVLTLPYLPGLIAQARIAPADTTLSVVYLGVFPTAIAYVTYAYVFSRLAVSRAVSFLYAIPVMAYVIAWFWLGEIPTPLSVFGSAVTLTGVLIVNTRGR